MDDKPLHIFGNNDTLDELVAATAEHLDVDIALLLTISKTGDTDNTGFSIVAKDKDDILALPKILTTLARTIHIQHN